MTSYTAPVQDMMFVLNHVCGFRSLPAATDLDPETLQAVLEEAAKLASTVISPLNQTGDKEGARLVDGGVKTAKGFRDAYQQYRQAGWNAVPFDPEYGGQGLPWALAFPVQEMWQAANMSFGLCPMLNQGAVEAIAAKGSDAQKAEYLPRLISGEWTGTMNLTEPQAGSDLAALRTRAERQPDGTFRLYGQKIFITYGDHDMTDNIIHLVIARIDGAPEGVKGISLFVVPKFLPDGSRNDVQCTGLEHKLGIHGSPTCTMQFGEKEGAVATLVGQENEGLKYMFIMMNNARLNVGLQGVAIADRACQHAVNFAKDRVQGTSVSDKSGAKVRIIDHPDVRRMLLDMRAKVEAGRLMAYEAALALDRVRAGDTTAQGRVDLLTPIVKAWCTDMAVDVASTGVQVHGGMGYVEETGAAQYYRDARILPIYEGTNGIQANDLVFRKVRLDQGAAALALLDDLGGNQEGDAEMAGLRDDLADALSGLVDATRFLCAATPEDAASVAVPYLQAFGLALGAGLLARSVEALPAYLQQGGDGNFAAAKRATALFYAAHILPQAMAALATVMKGAESVRRTPATAF